MAGRQGVDGVGGGGWGIEQESEDMVPLRLLMVFFFNPNKNEMPLDHFKQ